MPKLIHLRTENFKKIIVADVHLGDKGNLVTVVGPNDSGKSSFLDSISYLFGGAKFAPEMPVRIGAEVCKIVGTTDTGLVFKRRATASGDTFIIESSDGATYKSPQAVADALFDPIAFEPDAFTRLSTKEQASMLRRVTGVDTSTLDSRRKKIFEDRAKVNVEVKFLAGQAEGIVIPIPPKEVGEEIDIAAVAEERAAIVRANNEANDLRDKLDDAISAASKKKADIEKFKVSLARMEADLVTMVAAEAELQAAVEAIVDRPTDELDAKIANANTHNAVIRGNIMKLNEHKRAIQNKTDAEKRAKDRRDAAEQMTEQIETIDAEKAKMLESAKFPVSGMAVIDDEVFVNNVPFSQIASSEQLRIGMAMAMAQKSMQTNKSIRICLIKDGDRIGDAKREIILKWAVENDVVIFEERVARPGVVGIELEDGHLKGVELPPPAAEEEPAPKKRRKVSAKDAAVLAAAPDSIVVAMPNGEDPPE